jgi:hypothetical protein
VSAACAVRILLSYCLIVISDLPSRGQAAACARMLRLRFRRTVWIREFVLAPPDDEPL